MDTNGYGGKALHKTIRVITNDPAKPETQLTVSGSVSNFVSITPQSVRLFGQVGVPLKDTVRIVPEEKYPFKIIDTKAQIGRDIRYRLTEEKQDRSVAYLLTVENVRQNAGRFYDTISLTTDSRIKPQINIRVFGKLSESGVKKAN